MNYSTAKNVPSDALLRDISIATGLTDFAKLSAVAKIMSEPAMLLKPRQGHTAYARIRRAYWAYLARKRDTAPGLVG